MFGSQPQFAKPNFDSHKLFSLCLVFTTLVVCHTSLIIWSTCHRVNFLANSCQSLAFNFLATLLWLATLWFGKMWLGTKHPLKVQHSIFQPYYSVGYDTIRTSFAFLTSTLAGTRMRNVTSGLHFLPGQIIKGGPVRIWALVAPIRTSISHTMQP
jgi:hypothetical protein